MNRTLTLLVALSLVACGGAAAEPKAPDATPTGPKAASATTAAAGPSDHASKVEVSPAIKAVVDAADRDADDKAIDAGRHPAELLAFMGLKPGMKVAEIGAGGGYTAELLARAVAPSGTVYGVNSPFVLERFAGKPWAARLAKPVNKNIVNVVRNFDDPLPPEATNLDAVIVNLVYHDIMWMDVDRAKMNAAVLKALKPGGIYVIVDHSGRPGTGTSEIKTTHRVEEKVVREEIEKAGFKLAAEGSFLRNPEDARDWNTAPFAAGEKRGTSDRFALKFVKP